MKHYIYIDKEILNSYISQIYGGILSQKHTERLNSTENSNQTIPIEDRIKAVISGKFEGKSLTESNTDEIFSIDSIRNTDMNKEVVEKIYHDNLLDNLIEYIKEKEDVVTEVEEITDGKFVFIDIPFSFVNNGYLNSISNDSFKKSFEKILNSTGSSNDDLNKKVKKSIELIANFSTFFESCFPTKQLIITDNLIIPLSGEYLRETPEMIDFKYGGNIKVFGKVTKNCSNNENSFALYNEQFNKSLSSVKDQMYNIFLPNYKKSFVITPIALYFE